MAENTKIEWAHHTFNPWIGCTKVSPACDNCYAEADFATRRKVVQWGAGQPRKLTADSTWAMPRRWNAEAERLGVRYRVFCASLADVFDNEVPAEWRTALFALIAATPHLDWLLLTKRIGNVVAMAETAMLGALQRCVRDPLVLPANVWLGASITSQAEAERDIPKLLAVPAATRFLSMEPLLGPVDLGLCDCDHGSIPAPHNVGGVTCPKCDGTGGRMVDWVIVGGESGPNARPMHPDWARSLRDQCRAAGVPFLFKQWGEKIPAELQPHPDHENDGSAWRVDPNGGRWHVPCEAMKPPSEWEPVKFIKVGKKAAGRLLDGRTWDEVPS